MFEARLTQGHILKKIFDAIKELCTDVNFEVSDQGIKLQAMDSSHVSLVSLEMNCSQFEQFRCDRSLTLGLNMGSVTKIFKVCQNNDVVSMKAKDEGDLIEFTFEAPDGEDNKIEKVSHFELKLMDIDSEHLGIPETEYQCEICLPSAEFSRIVRDMQAFGDTMKIECDKEGVRYSVTGDIGTGKVMIKPNNNEKEADKVTVNVIEPVSLSFALRYLNYFAKAAPLCDQVVLSMHPDTPLVVKFALGTEDNGCLKFFLAPKINEGEEEA
eukprot:TRINITY_DN135765_c0_g1_i1.p1 TRINITY_DN135765_c0_g1~~TRINITY_DN135765_c0_g1_i1.p1  ORF type:complete len:269 (-),score=27.22 TRINITY_DN135765_c0_g1_i1:131-937(-)